MEELASIWPFNEGHQVLIFHAGGIVVYSLIALNLISSLRQKLPLKTIVSSIFSGALIKSNIEKTIELLLSILLAVCFLILVLDTQINGMQLISEADFEKMEQWSQQFN